MLYVWQCVMEPETGQPTDQLAPVARRMIEALGSSSVKVSEVIHTRDKPVFSSITDGLHRANSLAPTTAHTVWIIMIDY